ncbi:response regulator [Roseburia sp. 499]|uniref:response regulator n=1 Tax=Roseburia sp. 499 TaxID=1261634 RepID=UPI000952AF80|nr:response regulator [Roseburia sp. 499]WVK70000.1 response regulator [Roseburia sp. 499]
MKDFLKRKWQVILYFILLGFTFFFFHLAGQSGEDYRFKLRDEIEFESLWKYEFSNGTSGVTELPAQLEGGDSEKLTLTNTLPEMPEDTTFVFRSRHKHVKIYVGGRCVYDNTLEEKETVFPMPGNVWIEVSLGKEDSGKEIRLEETGDNNHYLEGPGSVYLGERASFLMKLQSDNIGTIVGASVLLIIAFILLMVWIMLYIITRESYNECLCLALFTLSISLWGYTESRNLQFVFSNMKQFSIFAFEILALAPVPIARYFAYSEREKTKRLAKIAATIPMVVWIMNNTLHFLHIKDLAETLKVTQIMIVADTIFIAYIQVSDIIYNLKRDDVNVRKSYWRIPLYGLGVLVPLLMVDLSKYILSNKYYVSQANLTCIGIVVYILTLACHSGLKLVSENFKAMSANEAKSQFLANMSHEIRTPLNAMLGLNEMILRSTSDEKILEYASDIQNSGENLKEIINKILDLSKIESGKMEIINISYSTVQLLDNVTSMITALAEKKGLYLKLEIDPNLPEQLIGDDAHIRQVLVNLMTNAVKYTKEGGVTFKVQMLEEAKKDKTCKVLFSVKDTGIGIREEDKERLFVKFERLDYNKNKNVEGTGLGMNIVQELLGAMRSKIEVDSIYGKGSEFYFILPQRVAVSECIGDYEAGRRNRSKEKEQRERYIAPEARILIVDDVPVNLKVARGLLKPIKIQIDTADSGMAAVGMVEKHRYDVVLMDHMMPGMNGIEATKRIRELTDKTGDTYYCKLPILALTANVMTGMYEKYIEEGMQDFVSKPIDGNELEEVLRKWLPKEKIIYEEDSTQEAETATNEVASTEWEVNIAGIDAVEAKKYYSDKDLYEECLNDYLVSAPKTAEKIRKFREEHDQENYTITVHGLKSASKVVGAMEISERARQLEEYCHQGDYESAWNGTDELLEMLEQCAGNIRQYLGIGNDESVRMLSKEEMLEELSVLKSVAENFDMQGLLEWEKALEGAGVQEAYMDDWSKIKEAVENVAFLDIVEQISKIEQIL